MSNIMWADVLIEKSCGESKNDKKAENIFSQRYFTKEKNVMSPHNDFVKGMFTM